jgi:hypothetical protein
MSEDSAYTVSMDVPFANALDLVTDALKEEGFGVLTKIAVKETMKKKLGKDFCPYVILGACNPPSLPCTSQCARSGHHASMQRDGRTKGWRHFDLNSKPRNDDDDGRSERESSINRSRCGGSNKAVTGS